MTTTQLRRYELFPAHFDAFLAWWPQAKAARLAAGFDVPFAYALREQSEFVWAVAYPGDRSEFEAAVERYGASPERAAAFAVDPRAWIATIREHFVDDVVT